MTFEAVIKMFIIESILDILPVPKGLVLGI